MMMQYIGYYILVGALFALWVDIMNHLMSNHPTLDYDGPNEGEWGIKEHIMAIIFWPWCIFVFIRSFRKKN